MFWGAGAKDRLHNKGQKKLRAKVTRKGPERGMTFQDVNVRKPLAAVSSITHKNNLVMFDMPGNFILPGNAPEVAEIRRLANKVKNRIKMEERRGVYVMSLWVKEYGDTEPTEGNLEEGFPGQGQ